MMQRSYFKYCSMVKGSIIFFIFHFSFFIAVAQTPKTYTSSEILLQLKKLNVLGSVLYIAAHPDDENTRLLAYLANEKMYRTGYLSLTRGDGGQNLIGDEQGIDLGLIRTQELLAARRIDGAEQFFSRAYDFGFCKSSDEAIRTWGHDKILSDIVWVIRKFKPDVIITRFPEDNRAGHGHHSASAILASEAFDAAADATKFPEQFSFGVQPWQAKRLLWNTFNFGTTNTQSDDQFKFDVGMYNPLLGKSYGEIAALSRSQHKSQGFGVPAQRGETLEYFVTTKGTKPEKDLMDGVDISWDRTLFGGELISRPVHEDNAQNLIDSIIKTFSEEHPEKSVPALVRLYNKVKTTGNNYWREQKLREIQNLIEVCSGLFLDATTNTQYAVQGDTLKVFTVINNRSGININAAAWDIHLAKKDIKKNINQTDTIITYIQPDEKLTQPYWLEQPMEKGSFNVTDQQLIGKAENNPISIDCKINIEGTDFTFNKPIRYKYTDPIKGEIYQPVYVTPSFVGKFLPEIKIVASPVNHSDSYLSITSFKDNNRDIVYEKKDIVYQNHDTTLLRTIKELSLNREQNVTFKVSGPIEFEPNIDLFTSTGKVFDHIHIENVMENSYVNKNKQILKEFKTIKYDHIPQIVYFKPLKFTKEIDEDIKTVGKNIGYIIGAGDKVPQALEQMGYKVTMLKEADITKTNLKQFDAIVTGVRAYNTNDWMINSYDVLMQYVKEGGVLLSQYNTNNFISSVKSKIGPYPFTISRSRITDETAKVNFLLPKHPVLNYPNKITEKDFDGWIQERSIYNAENIDSNYQRVLSMKDPGENEQEGSLIIADYGKGRFIYTGLVFFRELPAGVPGAYRLLANLLANKNARPSKAVKKHK
ncbi:PIG-L family deacetylase [Ferruginibacter lapsinanis]|uniref:PIG-L family deacetylase n=1 Tax=Ferruginibacter lapsinanis TaxID=563172 RepID=UPI001E434FCB|nr:PIG-L family deacetylase [Ferruginibacter lapsinanis]UEG48620.1 PIG-L family deacetylase [Ferruginibacter lapsinanis]